MNIRNSDYSSIPDQVLETDEYKHILDVIAKNYMVIRCLRCKDIIYSSSKNEYQQCFCGNCCISGGPMEDGSVINITGDKYKVYKIGIGWKKREKII